jgi:hypothetical protein
MQYVGLERAEQGEMSDRWERAVIWEVTADLERAVYLPKLERAGSGEMTGDG